VRITTPRLLLREYAADDLPAMRAYNAHPGFREFHGPGEGEPEQVRALLELFTGWAAEVPRLNYQLAITPRGAPAEVIGSAGLRGAGLPAGEAELGLELAADAWGRGYATEVAAALLDAGFGTLGLHAVRASTVSANERATGLVRHLGFERVRSVEGAGWLSARGWTEVAWRLDRGVWGSPRAAEGEGEGRAENAHDHTME